MNKKIVPASEYKDVTNVVSKYAEAIRNGDVDMMADIFYEGAVTYGIVDGKLEGGASNPAIDFINRNGKSPELEYQIDVLDITPTTAVVRLITEKDSIGTDCCEHITLIKVDTGWIVISKAFLQFDK